MMDDEGETPEVALDHPLIAPGVAVNVGDSGPYALGASAAAGATVAADGRRPAVVWRAASVARSSRFVRLPSESVRRMWAAASVRLRVGVPGSEMRPAPAAAPAELPSATTDGRRVSASTAAAGTSGVNVSLKWKRTREGDLRGGTVGDSSSCCCLSVELGGMLPSVLP